MFRVEEMGLATTNITTHFDNKIFKMVILDKNKIKLDELIFLSMEFNIGTIVSPLTPH